MAANEEIFTVSELNQYIKDVVSAGFPRVLWVCGEVQRLRIVKGHVYFDLVEKDEKSSKVSAAISATIWSSKYTRIQRELAKSENAFELKDDIEVKLSAKVDFWPVRGSLSLHVEEIDPTYTLGRMAQEKKKLIEKLQKKGTFDKNKQLEIPLVPLNIGLITSIDSAAANDFLSEFKKSRMGFKVYLRSTVMQGKKTQADVCQAIDDLHKLAGLDALVITRGGGSQADLSWFDSEKIAERIAQSRLPVLTGIGHEIDLSVTDLAAHTHAKTPTAIAQYLVNRVQQFLDDIDQKVQLILDSAQAKIDDEKYRLKSCSHNLQSHTIHFLKDHNEQIIQMMQIIKDRPQVQLRQRRQLLKDLQASLKKTAEIRLQSDQEKLRNYHKMIDIVHPRNTIKRGFSITRTKDGKIAKSIKGVKSKEELITEVVDGKIHSEVTTTKK